MSELVKNPKYCIFVTAIRKNPPQKDFDSSCHFHAVVKKIQVDSKTKDLALFLSECSCNEMHCHAFYDTYDGQKPVTSVTLKMCEAA